MKNFNSIKKVHFIGIGGIGMSALAQLYLYKGKVVSGSDLSESPATSLLKEKGATFFLGHDKTNVSVDTDLIIYSDAVPKDNVERIRGKEFHMGEKSYFEALGEFANQYELVAVSGTHGKTTTTAMLIDVFEEAGLDPMAIVGSLRLPAQAGAKTKSNFRAGAGNYFIVEADEYMRHFLQFEPKILVITNIDSDHLDYYKNLNDIQSAFNDLAVRIPKNGFVVCDPNDENVLPALVGVSAQVIDYTKFLEMASELKLKVTGEHNRKNASVVLALTSSMGFNMEKVKSVLSDFSGTWRRFEYKGKMKSGAIIYDDYAHHPAEIAATLSGAREAFPDKKITIIFQPHLYSRTKLLLNDFAESLSKADYAILADIYAAREKPDETISSKILAEKIKGKNKKVRYFPDFGEIEKYLSENAVEGDLLITMGAGDIYKVGEELLG
ncbi:MAG: UDP-N-acetylmuramate--L-alanine ligase [Patescibacteria group bacterium]